MTRPLVAYLTAGVLCFSPVVADDKRNPVDDPVAAELTKAKEVYQAAVKLASEKLVAAFADEQKKLEENTRLKVAEQIKLVEQIQAERKAFEADTTKLPKSAGMKVAVSDYKTKTTAAKMKCETAFDKAAESYRNMKDLVTAKAVLAGKAEFFKVAGVAKAAEQRSKWTLINGKWGFKLEADGTWTEGSDSKGGTVYRHKETGRNKEYVELYDAKRDVGIRLYVDHCDIKLQRNPWKLHQKGKWASE